MQLHQQVLLKLHTQLGTEPKTGQVYYAAMAAFDITDVSSNQRPHTTSYYQTMLLMAQNGLPDLTAKDCDLQLEVVDEYSEGCLRHTFGDASFDKVGLFSLVMTSWQLQEMLSPFLPCLPEFVIRQLDTQKAHLDLAGSDMPHFMIPADATTHTHLIRWMMHDYCSSSVGRSRAMTPNSDDKSAIADDGPAVRHLVS